MATTFFLVSSASSATVTGFSGTKKELLLTRGGSAASQADATAASISSDGSSSPTWGTATTISIAGGAFPSDGLIWITNPLNAVTISGNITANVRAQESNAMANYGVCYGLYKVTSGGTVTSFGHGTIPMGGTPELGTSESARSDTAATAGGAISAGERLVVVIAWVAAGGTSASGYTATGWYNGPTSAASGDTFMTFTETITEQSGAAADQPFRQPMIQLLAH